MTGGNTVRVFTRRQLLLSMVCVALCGTDSIAIAEMDVIGSARVVGKLSVGVLRTGGETTGTVVRVGEVEVELDLSVDRRFSDRAEEWEGEVVEAFGKLHRKELVEQKGRFRWILQPDSFKRSTRSEREPQVQVAVTGTVKSGQVAIGAETTGRTIHVKQAELELDLKQNQKFVDVAEQLDPEDSAVVIGTLQRRRGVELKRDRWIVEAKYFEPAPTGRSELLRKFARGTLE